MEPPRIDGDGAIRLELFVRSLAPSAVRPAQESVVRRLQRLEGAPRVATVDVHVSGDRVCRGAATARTRPGRFLLDRLDAFAAWEDRTDRSIGGTFEHVADARGIDGADCSGVRFPAMVLAEYVGGDLRFVAPSASGGETTSVPDRVEHLERQCGTAIGDAPGREPQRG